MAQDYSSRFHDVQVGGKSFVVDGIMRGSEDPLSKSGLIRKNCTVYLLDHPDNGETIDPHKSTNNRWFWGNSVNITVEQEAGPGSTIPHPSWGSLKLLKNPYYDDPEDGFTPQLRMELGCDLTYFDRDTPPDEKSGIDPDVGLAAYQVIDNLLQAGGHPGLTFTPGEFDGTPMNELLFYPLQKFDNQSFVVQAGHVAFGVAGGPWFLWQNNAGETRLYNWKTLISTPQFTLDQASELPRKVKRVDSVDWAQPVELMKVNGTILSVNDCDHDCNSVNEKYGSRKDLRPGWMGQEAEVLLYRYTKICTLVGNTYTVIDRAEFTHAANPNPALWFEYTEKETREISVYGGEDLFLLTHTKEEYAAFITPSTADLEIITRTIERYEYSPDKFPNRRLTEYFIRLLIVNGIPQPAVDQGAGPEGELNRVGADLETWVGPTECNKFEYTTTKDTTLPTAIGDQTYVIKWESNKEYGTQTVDGPPEAQERPKEKAPKEDFKEVECRVDPVNGSAYAVRERVETLEFVQNEQALNDACSFYAQITWARVFGRQKVIPFYDKVLTAAASFPFFRYDFSDGFGSDMACIYEAPQYVSNDKASLIEIETPVLGFIVGGVVGSNFIVKGRLRGEQRGLIGQTTGELETLITDGTPDLSGDQLGLIGQQSGELLSTGILELESDQAGLIGEQSGQLQVPEVVGPGG